jgi:hypothetical protein
MQLQHTVVEAAFSFSGHPRADGRPQSTNNVVIVCNWPRPDRFAGSCDTASERSGTVCLNLDGNVGEAMQMEYFLGLGCSRHG